MRKIMKPVVLLGMFMALPASICYGWSCQTHSFIAHQAGLDDPENACVPDASRYDNYNLLVQFHYHNAAPNTAVSPEYIDKYGVSEQEYVPKADPASRSIKIMVPAESGVLYWKIVDLYRKIKTTKYSSDYNYGLMTIAHLIGDLSQPLHNYPYKDEPASDGKVYHDEGLWSGKAHGAFDARFDEVLPYMGKGILSEKIVVSSEDDLKREIVKIANSSISIANAAYKENGRKMTDDEVAHQVASSVVLLRAVLNDTRRIFEN